jgi:FK506-binding nuclear protein
MPLLPGKSPHRSNLPVCHLTRDVVALYGLEVPCGDVLIPAVPDFPATVSYYKPEVSLNSLGISFYLRLIRAKFLLTSFKFRITMAAIDPSEPAEVEEASNGTTRPRATLKIVRQSLGSEDDEESQEYMRALLAESDSEDDSEEDEDEEANGGPSDPSKSKKARKAAALQQLMETLGGDSDDEMEDAGAGNNGTKAAKKGKAKASSDDEEESEDDEEDSDDELEVEEFVLCTLDPEKVRKNLSNIIIDL